MTLRGVAGGGEPGAALLDAVAVMDRLRSPGGCPWDAEQTHASLARYAIEEAYEVAEAAESGDARALLEELGDLLLQVLFHARVAQEADDGAAFDIDDVARALVTKLTARHPHVFAADGGGEPPAEPLTAAEVNVRWDAIKAAEKVRRSVLDGVPVTLPALARAQKVVSRARKAGIAVGSPADERQDERQDEVSAVGAAGAALLALVRRADASGVDAESALREATRLLETQVRAAEE